MNKIIILIIALILVYGCAPTTIEGITQPDTGIKDTDAMEEADTAMEEAEESAEAAVELLSLQCAGDNVEGVITNTLTTSIVTEDIRVVFNGDVVDNAAIRCEQTALQPDQSMKCMSMQGVLPVKAENDVAVVIGTESMKLSISC